jgi:hypothetical protein
VSKADWRRPECAHQCALTPSDVHHLATNANQVPNKKRAEISKIPARSVITGSLSKPPLRGFLEALDLAHPAGQWVPSGENLGHNPILFLGCSALQFNEIRDNMWFVSRLDLRLKKCVRLTAMQPFGRRHFVEHIP